MEMLGQKQPNPPMSLRGGTTKQSRSYSIKHILITQGFYMPQKFSIFVYTTARFPFKKGNLAVLLKEKRAQNRLIFTYLFDYQ